MIYIANLRLKDAFEKEGFPYYKGHPLSSSSVKVLLGVVGFRKILVLLSSP